MISNLSKQLAALLAAGLVLFATQGAAQAQMSFKAIPVTDTSRCGQRCPTVIQAEGRITNTTAQEFVAFASELAGRSQLANIVLIDSPGGSVLGSLHLGAVFRTLGATVVVARVNTGGGGFFGFGGGLTDSGTGKTIPIGAITNANCNSACVYAVMGGRKRVIPEQSHIGIHSMQAEVDYGFDPATSRRVSEKLKGTADQVTTLKRYARTMGIDQRLIALAESIPHEQIKILSAAEVRKFRLGISKL